MHNTKHSNFLWSNFILFICFFHFFYLEVSFVDSIEHSAVSIRIWPKATANSIAHHLIPLISYFISHSQVFPDQIKIRPNWSFMKSSSTLSLLVAMGIIFRSFATLRRAILNNNYVCDQKSKNLSTTFSWNHLFLCEYNVPLNQIVDIKKLLMQAIEKNTRKKVLMNMKTCIVFINKSNFMLYSKFGIVLFRRRDTKLNASFGEKTMKVQLMFLRVSKEL